MGNSSNVIIQALFEFLKIQTFKNSTFECLRLLFLVIQSSKTHFSIINFNVGHQRCATGLGNRNAGMLTDLKWKFSSHIERWKENQKKREWCVNINQNQLKRTHACTHIHKESIILDIHYSLVFKTVNVTHTWCDSSQPFSSLTPSRAP